MYMQTRNKYILVVISIIVALTYIEKNNYIYRKSVLYSCKNIGAEAACASALLY